MNMMNFADYQVQARRTQNPNLTPRERLEHALWGLTAEVGEVCSLHQKTHQGHAMDGSALRKEIGDCLWFIGELCDVYGYEMGAIAEQNIDKLRKRFPTGFDAAHSLHRSEGDV